MLGRGGAGKVFLAVHKQTGETKAVKVGRRNGPSVPIELATQLLCHPHAGFIGLERVGTWNHRPVTIMEHFNGQPLLKQPRTFEWTSVVNVGRQIAAALVHLHQLGWLHRDIQPCNVLVNCSGQTKLIDFDLAISLDQRRLTDTIAGTPDYVAPEQVSDTAPLTDRTDIYSLGCTLFHLLTGKPPFAAAGTSLVRRLWAHVTHAVPRLDDCGTANPRELSRLVEAMLDKSPSARPSAAEVAECLADIESGAPLRLNSHILSNV
jgi:serine/threonine-protein kinase